MISDIRNPWIRRPLVVLAVLVFWPVCLLLRACEKVVSVSDEELGDVTREAWKGPK